MKWSSATPAVLPWTVSPRLLRNAGGEQSDGLHRNLIQQIQIFAFCNDPPLPGDVLLNPNSYGGFGGTFLDANDGAYLDAN
jgi:hypothetical protein